MKDDRRDFGRFSTELKACYSINNSDEERKECSVINMSRKGLGLLIKTGEKIDIGSAIRLEILVPERKMPAVVQGVIKWVKKMGGAWTAGVECAEVLEELEFSKRT